MILRNGKSALCEMENLYFAKRKSCTLRNGRSVLCEKIRNLYFAKSEICHNFKFLYGQLMEQFIFGGMSPLLCIVSLRMRSLMTLQTTHITVSKSSSICELNYCTYLSFLYLSDTELNAVIGNWLYDPDVDPLNILPNPD